MSDVWDELNELSAWYENGMIWVCEMRALLSWVSDMSARWYERLKGWGDWKWKWVEWGDWVKLLCNELRGMKGFVCFHWRSQYFNMAVTGEPQTKGNNRGKTNSRATYRQQITMSGTQKEEPPAPRRQVAARAAAASYRPSITIRVCDVKCEMLSVWC